MPDTLQHLCGVPVLTCAPDGPIVRTDRDAMDLIGEAAYCGARWAAVPDSRFDDAFFQLDTRVAGEIFQKFVTYRIGLAITGNTPRHTIASSALRDFVHETNQGRHVWLVPDVETLRRQLQRTGLGTD